MKKVLCFLLMICLLVGAAGCKATDSTTDPVDTTSPSASIEIEQTESLPEYKQLPMTAVSMPAVTESTIADDGTVVFNYTYQNMSLILQDPEVADKVIIDFLNRIDTTNETAANLATSAQSVYTQQDSWIPYLCSIVYSPMRIDQGVLSLSGTLVTYSGASHPERSCVAASYDLVTGDVLTLASIMSTTAKADDFCRLTKDALKEVADAKYLYEGYESTVDERFAGDLTTDENWFFTHRGLCFYFAPYEIAPYASGIITVEIPYEKLAGLLYDGYFPAERQSTGGTVTVSDFEQSDLQQFTQIGELVLHRDAQKVLLHTDGSVQDLRLIVSANASTNEVYTAFAAHALSPGDAVVIEATQEQQDTITLTYLSGEESYSIPLQ